MQKEPGVHAMSFQEANELQRKAYRFIASCIKTKHMPPTNREIGHALGISSTGHIDFLLEALEQQGLIKRVPKKGRGIILTGTEAGIPITGTIAAGAPLDIFPNVAEFLPIEADFREENVFALRVRGQSMIEEHICDGDYVIITSQSTCQNGDIVVATRLLDGINGSATLKRFFQEPDQVRLQPANSAMEPLFISKREWDLEWEVQGKVLSIHRQYGHLPF
jgi:repressor LexA